MDGSKSLFNRGIVAILALVAIASIAPSIKRAVFPDPPAPPRRRWSAHVELTEKTFPVIVNDGYTFVKFYAPWCGHCKALAPVWDDLVDRMRSETRVQLASMDCSVSRTFCREQEVKGYPTLVFYNRGEKIETFEGDRKLDSLQNFVQEILERLEMERIQKEDPAPPITVLDRFNFSSAVAYGTTFVKFYAPYCGHSLRVHPIWEELSRKFKHRNDVTIAKMDCTSDPNDRAFCKSQDVYGFPTLTLYKDGAKVDDYSKKRNIKGLTKFVRNHAGRLQKDEL